MTRTMTTHSFPHALLSSTLGTVLVSMTAVWLATAAYAPLTAAAAQTPHSTSSQQLYRLSPVPAGADWTS